jgi:hypothetical protein
MGDVVKLRRRGGARSREVTFDESGLTSAERATFPHCGATFFVDNGGVAGCPLPPGHEGRHCDGRWSWSDGDDAIVREGGR